MRGLRVFDLRATRDDSCNWDLSLAQHRREALAIIESDNPDFVIRAPPCTAFSALNVWFNYPSMEPEAVQAKLAAGLVHLRFAAQICRSQVKRGKFFLYEHPRSARSWSDPAIKKLLSIPGVGTTTCDQCMFGLETFYQRREARFG